MVSPDQQGTPLGCETRSCLCVLMHKSRARLLCPRENTPHPTEADVPPSLYRVHIRLDRAQDTCGREMGWKAFRLCRPEDGEHASSHGSCCPLLPSTCVWMSPPALGSGKRPCPSVLGERVLFHTASSPEVSPCLPSPRPGSGQS